MRIKVPAGGQLSAADLSSQTCPGRLKQNTPIKCSPNTRLYILSPEATPGQEKDSGASSDWLTLSCHLQVWKWKLESLAMISTKVSTQNNPSECLFS